MTTTKPRQTITVTETTTLLMLKIDEPETHKSWCPECAAETFWLKLPTIIKLFGDLDLLEKCVIHFSQGCVCTLSLVKEIKKIKIGEQNDY